MTRKIKPVILAMLFVSVNALAMTSSRNKADRSGADQVSPSVESSTQTGSSTTSPSANTSGGSASDTSYDSSTRSTPPIVGDGSGITTDTGSTSSAGSTMDSTIDTGSTFGMDKESLRAQADKNCESSDTACLESKKAAEESLKRY